ncbi:proteasome accessory factor PafA2 [Arcanobacterium phocisimile]|uniref:Proteasome accessory factor PafA2 n=1 Tax=Arcanobacterium phocisimile TaxID=1302235 RepID=A0ABX7IE39_9ACTO|nr:depupylase/deamidase Dop [Arcanobacterium phocisimile]QRV01406.1 proteasome accessory factor PafA2 [Arcanobacterium phocisimile]
MAVNRIVGLETEFGILDLDADVQDSFSLSAQVVDAYARGCQAPIATWDFHSEDPLNDARGFRVGRQVAHPDQLTDNPVPPLSELPADTKITNIALPNGGRWYVDHAHPEYSTPEVTTPYEAVLWDRAGEALARETMDLLNAQGRNVVIYKNNVDGKGAAYGSHENYLLSRQVPFNDVIRYLTPFFVSRQILCGTGRVGLGQASQASGFQISQRADYVENVVGLETTFNRPIINSRDEPHATPEKYRRLHVIGGDANQFDQSILLKVGTTNLVLWMLEQDAMPLDLESLVLFEPVAATWEISHDPTLRHAVDMHDGSTRTAIDIQQIYLDAVRTTIDRVGQSDPDTAKFVELWQSTLDTLRTDLFQAAPRIEWIAKYQMLDHLRQRSGSSWDSDQLRAFDLQWHDLRPSASIVHKLDQAGRVDRLYSAEQIAQGQQHAPHVSRAYFREVLLRYFEHDVRTLGWSSAVLDTTDGPRRINFMDPHEPTFDQISDFFATTQTPLSTYRHFGTDLVKGE